MHYCGRNSKIKQLAIRIDVTQVEGNKASSNAKGSVSATVLICGKLPRQVELELNESLKSCPRVAGASDGQQDHDIYVLEYGEAYPSVRSLNIQVRQKFMTISASHGAQPARANPIHGLRNTALVSAYGTETKQGPPRSRTAKRSDRWPSGSGGNPVMIRQVSRAIAPTLVMYES
jgi:hypothetical protein